MISLHASSCIRNVCICKFVIVLKAVWLSVLKVNLYTAHNFIKAIPWSCHVVFLSSFLRLTGLLTGSDSPDGNPR